MFKRRCLQLAKSNPGPCRGPDGSSEGVDPSADLWRALPDLVWLRVASFLPPNEVACVLRLLNTAARALLSAPAHRTVHLSKPVPDDIFARRWGGPDTSRSLTFEQQKQLVVLTAASGGSAANLEVALGVTSIARAEINPDNRLFRAAAEGGNLEACKLLWQQVRFAEYKIDERNRSAMRAAADAGKYDICSWLHEEHNTPWSYSADVHVMGTNAMGAAAEAGKMAECRRLHEQYGMPYTEAVMTTAAHTGDLALCQSLQQAGCPVGQLAFKAAASKGHTTICRWLLDGGFVTHIAAAAAAAQAGKAALVTQLLDEAQARADNGGGPAKWWNFVLPSAAGGCDLRMLQALFERASAASGHATFVAPHVQSWILAAAITSPTADGQAKAEWLMTRHGFRLCDRTRLHFPSPGGDTVEVLKHLTWARNKGFMDSNDFGSHTRTLLLRAAKQGDLAGIELLLSAGITDGAAVIDAIQGGQWEAVRLLISRGHQPSAKQVAWLLVSLGQNVESMERVLEGLGPQLVLAHDAVHMAAEYGNIPLLTWLVDRHGCELDGRALKAARRGGCVAAVEWLVERGAAM